MARNVLTVCAIRSGGLHGACESQVFVTEQFAL